MESKHWALCCALCEMHTRTCHTIPFVWVAKLPIQPARVEFSCLNKNSWHAQFVKRAHCPFVCSAVENIQPLNIESYVGIPLSARVWRGDEIERNTRKHLCHQEGGQLHFQAELREWKHAALLTISTHSYDTFSRGACRCWWRFEISYALQRMRGIYFHARVPVLCDNLLWNKFNGMPFKSNVGRYLSNLSVGRRPRTNKKIQNIQTSYLCVDKTCLSGQRGN